jgi:hypothetical protein
MKERSKHNVPQEITPNPKTDSVQNPLKKLFLRVVLLLALVVAGLYISDSQGYFKPDQTSNHTEQKWKAFDDFTKSNNVDILMLGNSRLYTGINAMNLSIGLGANAFILASPGTSVIDSYYTLEEALEDCTPSLVVVETYGISNSNPYRLYGLALSNQFKSFDARRNVLLKLWSTPMLFSRDNYVYSWSTTLRNHDYIFTNPEQIKTNFKIVAGANAPKSATRLRLGQYARFHTGLADSTLAKYEQFGPAVDGKYRQINEYSQAYVNKIKALCQRKNIELVFVTLPMYSRHIKNHDGARAALSRALGSTSNWLDMQHEYSADDFPPVCFENTYQKNQHMTNRGALLATQKLRDYIVNHIDIKLPQRKDDSAWHDIFYGQEGYYEHFSPLASDDNVTVFATNDSIGEVRFKEVFTAINGSQTTIIAKLDKTEYPSLDFENTMIQLVIEHNKNGVATPALLDLSFDIYHTPDGTAVFITYLKGFEIMSVVNANFVTVP